MAAIRIFALTCADAACTEGLTCFPTRGEGCWDRPSDLGGRGGNGGELDCDAAEGAGMSLNAGSSSSGGGVDDDLPFLDLPDRRCS
eukprot:768217-Hanusia_phi.AAC.4